MVLYIPTVHAFGLVLLTHTLLVQTHTHDVSAPCVIVISCRDNFNWRIKHWLLSLKCPHWILRSNSSVQDLQYKHKNSALCIIFSSLALKWVQYFRTGVLSEWRQNGQKTKCRITKSPITKHSKLHIAKKNKTSNVTNCPKTKHPNNKTPKITKSPNLQNVQSYKMSKFTKCLKLQNVQDYKISKVTIFWLIWTIFMYFLAHLNYFMFVWTTRQSARTQSLC